MLTSPAPAPRPQAGATRQHHVRVDCAVTTGRGEPDARVSHIGGTNSDGTHWLLRQSDAIAAIEQGRWRFYLEDRLGHRTPLMIASHLGRAYLKAAGEDLQPDRLLSLAEHP